MPHASARLRDVRLLAGMRDHHVNDADLARGQNNQDITPTLTGVASTMLEVPVAGLSCYLVYRCSVLGL